MQIKGFRKNRSRRNVGKYLNTGNSWRRTRIKNALMRIRDRSIEVMKRYEVYSRRIRSTLAIVLTFYSSILLFIKIKAEIIKKFIELKKFRDQETNKVITMPKEISRRRSAKCLA